MIEVTLNIYAEDETTQVLVEGTMFTIGNGAEASVQIEDESLKPIHVSINRDEKKVWVLNESGTDTVFVNNELVSSQGKELSDSDRLTIGSTLVIVGFNQGLMEEEEGEEGVGEGSTASATSAAAPAQKSSSLMVFSGVVLGVVLLGAAIGGIALFATRGTGNNNNNRVANNGGNVEPTPIEEETPIPTPTPVIRNTPNVTTNPTPIQNPSPTNSPIGPIVTSYAGKQYKQMTEVEKNAFIKERAQEISRKMSNNTYEFTPEVIPIIKEYVDAYARRVGNNQTRLWGEDTQRMFNRAQKYAPYITRAFNEKGVPPVVGLYLVVVETEYNNIRSENFAGAAGLFQFICPTAKGYGVACEDRTNIEKMAPAAASYLSDRISEFGVGPMSVALSIAGYNRSPASVRRDLHDVVNSENKERSFWNLVANSTKLDHWFQGENIKYVPKYFGAAIVGENPLQFGLEMQALSTYITPTVPAAEL